MSGASAVLLPLLLLSGPAVLTAARSLNAPQDGRPPQPAERQTDGNDSLSVTVTGKKSVCGGGAVTLRHSAE